MSHNRRSTLFVSMFTFVLGVGILQTWGSPPTKTKDCLDIQHFCCSIAGPNLSRWFWSVNLM